MFDSERSSGNCRAWRKDPPSQIASFQVAEPVFSVRRAQGRDVFADKGLGDAVDVRANRFAISRAVVLCVDSGRGRREQRDAKHE